MTTATVLNAGPETRGAPSLVLPRATRGTWRTSWVAAVASRPPVPLASPAPRPRGNPVLPLTRAAGAQQGLGFTLSHSQPAGDTNGSLGGACGPPDPARPASARSALRTCSTGRRAPKGLALGARSAGAREARKIPGPAPPFRQGRGLPTWRHGATPSLTNPAPRGPHSRGAGVYRRQNVDAAVAQPLPATI